MDLLTVATFFALLALVAAGGAIGVLLLALASRWSEPAASAFASVQELVSPLGLWLAFAVAATATLGSLYFSEVGHLVPCTLCWYQRIAMYPLVPILAVAAARRDPGGRWYAIVLAGIGAVIAAYHVALEWIPSLDSGACDVSAPCTFVWFRVFGFISLPTLALIAFLFILTLLTLRRPR